MFLFIGKLEQYDGWTLSFKYISCSYLSKTTTGKSDFCENLNTSHVLIYQENDMGMNFREAHLNTSHVLIYL